MKSVFLAIISCLFVYSASAQTCLDDFCFLTAKYDGNISEELADGFSAFVINTDVDLNDLKRISDHLNSNAESRITLLLFGANNLIDQQLSAAGLDNYLYQKSNVDSLYGVVVTPKDRFFVFSNEGEKYLSFKDYIAEFDTSANTISKPTNYFTHVSISDQFSVERKSIDNLINTHGRLPNFLETKSPRIYRSYLDSLNAVMKFKAIVMQEGQHLEEVGWKEFSNLTSTGKVHLYERIVSPTKSGHRFSPDVSTYTPVNENVIKVFNANYLDVNEGLMMKLDFNNNIINHAMPEDKYLYGFVEYTEDSERGVYSNFDGHSNYIDFGIPSSMGFQEISVSAWVKPDTLNGNKSIVGIGEVFSAKVRDGKLTFTTPAIKDHKTDSVVVKKGQWQHVAFVYQVNRQMNFYYNGALVGSQPASDIKITSHSLLIGNNLWSEYFKGGLDDIYIWNRVLSDEEISNIYLKDLNKIQDVEEAGNYLMIAIGFGAFLVGFFFWKRKSNSITVDEKDSSAQFWVMVSNENTQAGIYLFGGFKLINKEGKDLTNLFSPKRKELFVLVLLYSFRKNGISSKQMSDILWEGHSFESAKNNRSTQMKRIREILSENTGVSIDYDNKNWKIEIEEGVGWDFSAYSYFKNKISTKGEDKKLIDTNVNGLLNVINQGLLLPNMHFEWLDPFKSQLAEEVIEILTPLMENDQLELDNELRFKISNSIFSLDPLNERALKFKIKLLILEGNHTLAKNAFDQFCNAYSNFYGEVYGKVFSSFT
jgi:DNA-binding SARP family transcriptional activator